MTEVPYKSVTQVRTRMNYRRKGLRALGLSLLAALGLMAFMAAGAQAYWLVEGKILAKAEAVAVKTHVKGSLLVPNQKLVVLCDVIQAAGLTLVPGGEKEGLAEGSVSFSECETHQNGKPAPVCDPQEPIVAGGKAHIVLHGDPSRNYVLFEPATGLSGVFTHVTLGKGLCALPKLNEVTGTLMAECLKNSNLEKVDCGLGTLQSEPLLQAVVSQGEGDPETLFPEHGLRFGANPAILDGVAGVRLNENHPNAPWGGHV
jgi:hypothetical protein